MDQIEIFYAYFLDDSESREHFVIQKSKQIAKWQKVP